VINDRERGTAECIGQFGSEIADRAIFCFALAIANDNERFVRNRVSLPVGLTPPRPDLLDRGASQRHACVEVSDRQTLTHG